MLPILAIDTSSRRAEVAFGCAGEVHAAAAELGLSHEIVIGSLLEEVLAAAGVALNQLRHLIVGSGPGSFTGLRIGYAFAKGLAMGSGLQVACVSSLEARARVLLQNTPGIVVSMSDARRQEVFCWGLFPGFCFALHLYSKRYDCCW